MKKPGNAFKEFDLIEKIKTWLGSSSLAVPIGDDTAAFKLKPDNLTLFSADSLVENVHFKLDSVNPQDLGYKSLAVNISDIVAMGGTPRYATICLSLPKKINLPFLKNFYKGLKEASGTYKMQIAGGDITASTELMISIAIIGQVSPTKILKRSTAKPGDLIMVTGTVGNSAAAKYNFRPTIRIEQAHYAAKIGVKTAIDISDGLVSDCQKICEASNVGCTIYADKVPVSNKSINLDLALSGGEDYELLFSAPESLAEKFSQKAKRKGWKITIIGKVTKNREIKVLDEKDKQIKWKKGYEHLT